MTVAQMKAYDTFLDENDWDIYYWATQQPSPTSRETAEGSGPELATPAAQGKEAGAVADESTKAGPVQPSQGEWKQTVESAGNFEGFRFLDAEALILEPGAITQSTSAGECVVVFLTLQDLQGTQLKEKHAEEIGRAHV